MDGNLAQRLAFCTLAVGLSTGGVAPAAATAGACPSAAPAVLHQVIPALTKTMPHDRYAAVRIRLDRGGRVNSLRLVWNSGDVAFNTAALHAAALSAYLPASRSCRAAASEFDYLFEAKAGAAQVRTSVIQQMRG